MHRQKSFMNDEKNEALYLVPTPIGNLEDMTFRAVRILKEVDLIAAEDTRNTKKLCHYYEIDTPITSYHEHNKEVSGKRLLEELKKGKKIAVVSDAGMPIISDPGYELVMSAIKEGLRVIPLPGSNAGLTALIASGLTPQPYYFYGFLNRKKKEKRKELEEIKKQTATIILYESPHRLKETVKLAYEILGNRKIVLCRELTKKFEEFLRGNLEDAVKWVEEEKIRGEFSILIEGNPDQAFVDEETVWWKEMTIKEHVEYYMNKDGSMSKNAIKKVAKDRNLPKRDIYKAYHLY